MNTPTSLYLYLQVICSCLFVSNDAHLLWRGRTPKLWKQGECQALRVLWELAEMNKLSRCSWMPEDVSNEAVLKQSQILDDIRCELPKCEENTAAEPSIGPVHELFCSYSAFASVKDPKQSWSQAITRN